jgi:hypothetical protein
VIFGLFKQALSPKNLIKEEFVAKEVNARRHFLVNAGKTTVAVTAASGMLLSNASASETKTQSSSVVKGTSKKEEILYQKTAHWENYYSRAY